MTSLFQGTGIMSHHIFLLITDYKFGKKLSLIVFRHKFYQKYCLWYTFFSFTIMACLKKLTVSKSLNTKQCPAGFSPRIIPSPPVSPLLPEDSKIKQF